MNPVHPALAPLAAAAKALSAKRDAAAGATLVDALTADTFTVAAGGTLDVVVAPHQARLLVPQDQLVPGL